MGWELGSGLGHVVPLLTVARRLRDHGHHPVLVLRDVVEPMFLLRQDRFPVLQAPLWQPPAEFQKRTPPTATFGDIMYSNGFGDGERIDAILTAWDGLIDLVRPDLVIAEFAPGLSLAARGRVPMVAMGNGFGLPPAELETFPRFQANVEPLIQQSELLAIVNEVQERRGARPLSRLPAVFEADAEFVYALPQLDPYGPVRGHKADGPLEPLPAPAPAPAEPHVFVYSGVEHTSVKPLIDGLGLAGLPATIYLRGASPQILRRLERPGMRFLEAAPPLADILPRCSMAVHYAGLGTTTACLAIGRPQLALPRQMERRMAAGAIRKLGVGNVIPGRFSADHFAECLLKTAKDAALAANAARLSETLAGGGFEGILDRVVGRCLELIDRS
jgi:hypothetical protein